MTKNEKERGFYKSFSLRLHNKTFEKLKKKKLKSGLSWNLFIYNLLKKNNEN